MGQFSWMYADKDNQESLLIGEAAFVACPDGSVIKEPFYEGYGRFRGYDIFELVADWNQHCLPDGYAGGRFTDFANDAPESFMTENYGLNWKRDIGLMLAFDDEHNQNLKFPIKICKEKPDSYEKLPPSLSDPNQGRLPAEKSKPSLDSKIFEVKGKQKNYSQDVNQKNKERE